MWANAPAAVNVNLPLLVTPSQNELPCASEYRFGWRRVAHWGHLQELGKQGQEPQRQRR
jgi:hypothetical protein